MAVLEEGKVFSRRPQEEGAQPRGAGYSLAKVAVGHLLCHLISVLLGLPPGSVRGSQFLYRSARGRVKEVRMLALTLL